MSSTGAPKKKRGKDGGYVAMKASPKAETYKPGADIKKVQLPKKVDMRALMTPVENQGNTSSCTVHAVVGAYQYWHKRLTNKTLDLSRLFVYYNARWRAGTVNKSVGVPIQLTMETIGDFGGCPEPTWPFDTSMLYKKPGADAYKQAASLRMQKRQRVPVDLDTWRHCLAEGLPIVFACVLFKSFNEAGQNGGVVRMPSPDDLKSENRGMHAMCCVGYSDVDKVFIVRNSWGTEWGEKGYCYIPYNFLMSPKFNNMDCWVFVPDHPMPLPVDPHHIVDPHHVIDPHHRPVDPHHVPIWFYDDKPVVNHGRGVDFLINAFEISAYAAIAYSCYEAFTTYEYKESVSESYSQLSEYVSSESWDKVESFESSDSEESVEEESDHSDAEDDSDDEDDADDNEAEDDSDDEDDANDDAEDDSDDEDDADDDAEDDSDDEDDADDDAEDDSDDGDDDGDDDDDDAEDDSDDEDDADDDAEDDSDDEDDADDDAEDDSDDGDDDDDDAEDDSDDEDDADDDAEDDSDDEDDADDDAEDDSDDEDDDDDDAEDDSDDEDDADDDAEDDSDDGDDDDGGDEE